MSHASTSSLDDRLSPDAALERDPSPPSDELYPSVPPGTRFKRYDSRLIFGALFAVGLAIGAALITLAP